MTIWNQYETSQRDEYIQFLQVYGALSNLFRQKHGDMIPYLDSKFQETIFARVFNSQNVDIGNTPHDILSVFGQNRIGIGLKTWMNSKPSYQKVMQLKIFRSDINAVMATGNDEDLAYTISKIKNQRLIQDYTRLGLSEDKNIYHYVTRDQGKFILQESAYPLVEIEKLKNFKRTDTSFEFSDGLKQYKYTYGDSQIFMKFGIDRTDTTVLEQFDVDIIQDPFDFLLKAYFDFQGKYKVDSANITEVYLPLYSYRTKEVEEKSGLNAWNAASKNKGSQILRPLNEVYIPIPREFHQKNPNFFVNDIFSFEKEHNSVDFILILPNGQEMPAKVCQSNMKGLQSGSNKREHRKADGSRYGQADLGQWLLVDVLGLSERKLVTREWLSKKGTDSVHLWYENNDKSRIHIDFAEVGAFEKFMTGEEIE